MAEFRKLVLYTGDDGRARFREEALPLDEGTPQARLSALFAQEMAFAPWQTFATVRPARFRSEDDSRRLLSPLKCP